MDEYLSKEQYGFSRESSTGEAIAVSKIVCERSLEHD